MSPRSTERPVVTPSSAVRITGMVRVAPAADLADLVEQHWIVVWDHRGSPPVHQEVLPDPCVNLAVEPAGRLVHGVASGRSVHELAGAGMVVGTKFRPGGFSGFVPGPVQAITDRELTLAAAFGTAGDQLDAELSGAAAPTEVIVAITAFLRTHRPAPDPQRALVAGIVEAMRAAPSGTRVADVAARFAVAPRTLQRLFRLHVGASPKQVLQRFRHQDAADRLGDAEGANLARLAAELGYFDQAHFARDFRAALGRSPSAVAAGGA